jgi:hypothetical protein
MRIRRLALLVAAVAVIGAVSSAVASPNPRHIQLGVLGDPTTFDPMTGQHTSVQLWIVPLNDNNVTPQFFANLFATLTGEPMLGLGVLAKSSLTPQAIAHGASDQFLVALNLAIASYAMPIYVRPMAEMNGWWNSYCAYNHNGSSKGPRYSTSEFRMAFRRIFLIVHGAPHADAQLRRMGLPPVSGSLMPAPMARVVWNPQGFGDPDIPGNSAQAYYPGNGYADVVGDDLYDQRFKAEWPAADALYRAHPHKPFSFPEWGLWGIDDPSFIRMMASFVHTHPRTILVSYFNQKPHSTWDLGTKPRSRAAYRQLIAPLGGG